MIKKIFGKLLPEIKDHIDSLTGLRAIAAGVVVLHHLVPALEKTWVRSLLEEFNIGVTIFFVLSGFLITYRYYGKYEKGPRWFYNYALNRVARIYPMYFLLTSFTFLFIFYTDHTLKAETVKAYFLNITFLRGFFNDYVYSGIAQGWTLTVEECFYFSAPFIFILSRKVHVLIQAACIFITGFLIYLVFKNTNMHGFMNNIQTIYITTYFGRVFEFAIGILTAFFFMKKKQVSYSTLKGGTLFLIFFTLQVTINHSTHKYALQTIPGFLINEFLLPIAVGLSIVGLIREQTYLKNFLQSKLMVILGKSSYTLYLLHWGTSSYLINRFISNNVFITILVTYIISILLWYFIEEPCNRYIRSFKISGKKVLPGPIKFLPLTK